MLESPVSSIGTPQNDSAQAVVVSGGAVYIAGYTHAPCLARIPKVVTMPLSANMI
jgi:hypothetical protein